MTRPPSIGSGTASVQPTPDERRLAGLLTDTLDLLAPYANRSRQAEAAPLGSLLERCRAEAEAISCAGKVPVRAILHWPGAGGEFAERMVAVQPGVMALGCPGLPGSRGQIRPTGARFGTDAGSDDLLRMAADGLRPAGDDLLKEMFLAAFDALYASATAEGRMLLLRNVPGAVSGSGSAACDPGLLDRLAGAYPMRSMILVRHPLESFLATGGGDVDDLVAHCETAKDLLAARSDVPHLAYEALIDDPETGLDRMLDLLDISATPDWHDLMALLPQGPGRDGVSPRDLSHGPLPPGLEEHLTQHLPPSYQALCLRLGYDPDPAARQPSVSSLHAIADNGAALHRRIETAGAAAEIKDADFRILRSEIEMLQHELSIAQKRSDGFSSATTGPKGEERDGTAMSDAARAKSQLGQDLWVLERTDHKRDGFFVEFGATDGVSLSNTWLLETDYGWKGICAEPNPKFFSKLEINRQCKVVRDCVGPRTGERMEFLMADVYGGITAYSDDDQHASARAAYRERDGAIMLTTTSLHDLLRRHGAPRDIDYLSIDTEGSEFDILNAFPFDEWNIRLLTVEHNFTPQRDRIHALLTHHGYRRIEARWDDWYEREWAS